MTACSTTDRCNGTERIKLWLMHQYRRLKRLWPEEKDADGKGGTVQ